MTHAARRRMNDYHLALDYDGGRMPLGILRRRLQRAGYTVTRHAARRSPSGRGWHVRVWLDPEPSGPMETVALQAVCGSDPLREACNVQRVRNLDNVPLFWRDRWNVLYTNPVLSEG